MNKQTDQRKKIQIDPRTHENLVHDKGASRITGAKINFLINGSHFNKWAKDKIRSIS